MEPLFINKCTQSKSVYREAFFNTNRRARSIFIATFVLLFLVIVIQMILFGIPDDVFFYLFIFIMSMVVFLLIPFISTASTYKRSMELHHQELVVTTSFFDEYFVSTASPSNATTTTNYAQIKRVISSKQLYLISVRYQLFYIIDKNGFDKINMLEFENFMREKCPKAKFRL